jgi:hypothetical protein
VSIVSRDVNRENLGSTLSRVVSITHGTDDVFETTDHFNSEGMATKNAKSHKKWKLGRNLDCPFSFASWCFFALLVAIKSCQSINRIRVNGHHLQHRSCARRSRAQSL